MLLVAMLAGILAPSLSDVLSQTAFDQVYEKTKQVTVKGMLIGSATTKPPYSVYLLVSVEDAKGNIQQWAVEGDSIAELRKRGRKDDALTMGEVITVTGHPARPGKRPEDRMPKPVRAGPSSGRSISQRSAD
jgi:hypothetical protein